jgi:hypothetical protein
MRHVIIDGLGVCEGSALADGLLSALQSLPPLAWRLTWLDRGGQSVRPIVGDVVPVARWTAAGAASGSALLQQICDHLQADVFLATGAATPTRTPSVLIGSAHPPGRIPERAHRRWRDELGLAVYYAREIIGVDASMSEVVHACLSSLAPGQLVFAPSALAIAGVLPGALERAASAANSRAYRDFVRNWAALRAMQAAVDLGVDVDG